MGSALDGIDGIMCDLDGVVYRGDEPVPGAAEAVERIRSEGKRIVFCTNNSRLTVAQYIHKLASIGIPATGDDLVTSAVVTAGVLQARGYTGRRILVVGGEGVSEALRSIGAEVVDDAHVEAVVVGWDPHFTYDKMKRAALAVRDGAALIATNDDAAFPAAAGELWPGAGAILASIRVATGADAEVMGKPHPPMMDVVAARLSGCRFIAAVGDRAETDLTGAAGRGWKTILVLSGVTDEDRALRLDVPVDVVAPSLAEV